MALTASPKDSFLLTHVCIFTGDRFIESGYVLVSGGKIADFGAGECLATSAAIPVISKPGYTVMPGLIDSHTHALGGNILCIEQALRFGVTTVCDMHNEQHHISKLKEV